VVPLVAALGALFLARNPRLITRTLDIRAARDLLATSADAPDWPERSRRARERSICPALWRGVTSTWHFTASFPTACSCGDGAGGALLSLRRPSDDDVMA